MRDFVDHPFWLALRSPAGGCTVAALLALALLMSFVSVLSDAVARGPLLMPPAVAAAGPAPAAQQGAQLVACNSLSARDCAGTGVQHAAVVAESNPNPITLR